MNKSKFLIIAVIVLLVSNLFLAGFILTHKKGGPHRKNPKELIVKKLDLDDNQVKNYEELIDAHKPAFIEKKKTLQNKKNDLYLLLQSNNDQTKSLELSAEIGELQREIEIFQFNHFKDIRQLCNPNQLAKFDELMIEIGNLFSPVVGPRRK